MVVVQAFLNISVVLGLMPTKGIPLPFLSYGGSSLFVTLASVGVLLNITQQTD
jgi:cell division protein FtsW